MNSNTLDDNPTNEHEIPININNNNIFDLTDILDSDVHNLNESFITDINNTIDFSMDFLKSRGTKNAAKECLPVVEPTGQFQNLFSNNNSFIKLQDNNNITDISPSSCIKKVYLLKSTIAIVMGYRTEISINFNEVNGNDENINVLPANGTAESIINWAANFRLDKHQQKAFEVITGYYILSYIYSLTDLEQCDDDRENHYSK